MDLPLIGSKALQEACKASERANGMFETFTGLCEDVAKGEWARGMKFDASLVARLILYHRPETLTHQPKTPLKQFDYAKLLEAEKLGKGKKRCPKCQEIVGIRSRTCTKCNHDFIAAREKVVVYDGPGRGRKQCPFCNKYVGLRATLCGCGHEFASTPSEDAPVPTADTVGAKRIGTRRSIMVPAGDCPVKLHETDQESVEAWAMKVREYHEDRGEFLAFSGLLTYVRQFVPMFVQNVRGESPEYRAVVSHLNELNHFNPSSLA